MGPYCNFCNQRCFTYMPAGTPQRFLDMAEEAGYPNGLILATCSAGQAHEKTRLGFNISDIRAAINEGGDADKQTSSE